MVELQHALLVLGSYPHGASFLLPGYAVTCLDDQTCSMMHQTSRKPPAKLLKHGVYLASTAMLHTAGYSHKNPPPTDAIAQSLHVCCLLLFQNEPQLLAMLDEVRQGGFSSTTQTLLHSLKRPLPEHDGITPTELYATNGEVRRTTFTGSCSVKCVYWFTALLLFSQQT